MRRASLLLAACLLAGPTRAASPSPSPAPQRLRIADLERMRAPAERRGWISTIENLLPLSLAVFLGLHSGHVHVEGEGGSITVTGGEAPRSR